MEFLIILLVALYFVLIPILYNLTIIIIKYTKPELYVKLGITIKTIALPNITAITLAENKKLAESKKFRYEFINGNLYGYPKFLGKGSYMGLNPLKFRVMGVLRNGNMNLHLKLSLYGLINYSIITLVVVGLLLYGVFTINKGYIVFS